MLLSYNWLKELAPIEEAGAFCRAMTLAGIETVIAGQKDGDSVLEISITPNRADCLSLFGIIREYCAVKGEKFSFSFDIFNSSGAVRHEANPVSIEITAGDECRRYSGILIKGVTVAESPQYVKARLEVSGIRPINNVVDATNYALIELGHPLHPFDASALSGSKLIVRKAQKGETLKTLDGITRKLLPEDLVIADSGKPVAFAGIMGGEDSGITPATKDVFLESAWFLPSSVRASARRHMMQTEASYRFARGTDIDNVPVALKRAVYLINKFAGGISSSICRRRIYL